MTDYDDDLDEMNLVELFVLGFVVGGVSIGIISTAIIWNMASYATEAVRMVRRLT